MPLLSLVPLDEIGGGFAVGLAAVLILCWSVVGWLFMVPQQARLAALDPGLAPVLFALNAAAIYVAASLGSAVGGAVLSGSGLAALGPVSAGIVVLAMASLPLTRRVAHMRRGG